MALPSFQIVDLGEKARLKQWGRGSLSDRTTVKKGTFPSNLKHLPGKRIKVTWEKEKE